MHTHRLLPLLFALGCGSGTSEPSAEPASEPPAPAATEAPASGAESRVALAEPATVRAALTDASGHVRVFNFWAMWCQPCIVELPHLAELAKDDPDAVEVMLVSLDHRSLGTAPVKGFLERQGLSMQSLMLDAEDPAMAMTEVYPDFPGAIPITLVVDAEGEIHKAFHRSVTLADLRRAVDEAR